MGAEHHPQQSKTGAHWIHSSALHVAKLLRLVRWTQPRSVRARRPAHEQIVANRAAGRVLRRSEETIELQPDVEYRQITVKLWGKGVVLRGVLTGAEIAASRQLVARRGQFILSRIDARNGALGIVPSELDEAIVTNDFLLSRTTFRCSTSSGIVYCQLISVGCAARRHSLKNANARAKAQPIACGGRKINFWRAKSRCRRWRSGGEWWHGTPHSPYQLLAAATSR